jgi:hypothetical protein
MGVTRSLIETDRRFTGAHYLHYRRSSAQHPRRQSSSCLIRDLPYRHVTHITVYNLMCF